MSENLLQIIKKLKKFRFLMLFLATFSVSLCSIYLYRENFYNFFISEDLFQIWDTDFRFILRQLFPNAVTGYRPVMFIWWWLGYLLFGYTPFAFRWIVALLHVINSIAVFTIVARVSRSSIAGFWAALLFLPMPIHSDAINWLSAASNQVTCGLFYLLTILLYHKYLNYYNKNYNLAKNMRLYCIILMVLSMATNEVALTIIFALSGLDIIVSRSTLKQLKYRLSPFWIAWMVFLVWRTLAVRGIGGYGASIHLRFGDFLFQTGKAIAEMLTLPWSSYELLSKSISFIFSNPVMLIIAIIIICLFLWRGRLGLVILAASVLPVLNIPAYHRLYIPAAGLAIAIGLSFAALLRLPKNRLRGVVLTLVGILVVFGSAQQSQALAIRNREWYRASTITSTVVKQTLALVPSPPSGSVFYYYGLPKNLGNGVQVFNWGLRQALQAAYNDRSLKAFRVKKSPESFLERSPEDAIQRAISETNQIFMVFDVNSLKLEKCSLEDFLLIVNTSTLGSEY